ncbi:MAG: DUF885 domain-containing protein [Planctomycetes bacterium]|nr:DUF885 domain-containing protein [Planctomycetota bacterium]
MHKFIINLSLILLTSACSVFTGYKSDSERLLNELITQHIKLDELGPKYFKEFQNKESDENELIKCSDEYLNLKKSKISDFINQAEKINEQELSEDDAITFKLLIFHMKNEVDTLTYRMDNWNIDHIWGNFFPHTPDKVKNTKDLYEIIREYKKYPKIIDAAIHKLKKGKKENKYAPAIAAERAISLLKKYLEENLKALHSFKEDAKKIEGAEIRVYEIEALIHHDVKEPLENLIEFIEKEIVPFSRKQPGLCALPEGKSIYRYKIREQTTKDFEPKRLHELGLSELATNQEQIMLIAQKIGFHGNLKEFITHLVNDPKNFMTDKNKYLDYMKTLALKPKEKLSLYFKNIEFKEIEIIEMNEIHAKNAPTAYGGEKYWVNTYDLKSRPLYTAAALTFHEADPGHHLHHLYNKSIKLPANRKYQYRGSAFGEGWAHYGELLCDEMGLYDDDMSKIGMYFYQAWRAARLVVDTGIHEFGWSREQAIDFFKDNLALGHKDIENEIDRYIIWPGQALAYKVGQLEIIRIRKKAEKALGNWFDIKDFHYQLFRHGSLPLGILEEVIDKWVQKVQSKAN